MNIIEGDISSKGYRFAIIVSKFNEFIGNKLLEGAVDCLKKHNYTEKDFDLIKVPGAFEIPIIAGKLASQMKYNAIIALGAVIRGATPHFDYISNAVSTGCAEVSIKYNVPVVFGVLTTNTVEQALERSNSKLGNKGWDAALTAIEMADLNNKLS
ncbi:MAG: 6,7-dimethyl-8-ribityllumazine synthase [Ignavibacteriaceae bacterium]